MALTTQLMKLAPAAALAALFTIAGSAQAAITAYSSSASFNAAVSGAATDSFDGLVIGYFDSPLVTSVGGYGYTASTDSGGMYAIGTASDVWLSTNENVDNLLFNGFSGGVQAIGGLFFGTDQNGFFASGQTITLTATDSFGATATSVITGATTSSFGGFTSTGTLTSLTASITMIGGKTWVTANDLVLAQVAAVPEPATGAMLLAGVAGLAAVVRRRRAR